MERLQDSIEENNFQLGQRLKKSVFITALVYKHRRTSQGAGAPRLGKAIILRAKAKFFGQKPAAKNEKQKFFCIY